MQTTTNKRSTYWRRRKHLADPTVDVICVVVLTVILLLTHYLHLSLGL
jgi:hypothetical protein